MPSNNSLILDNCPVCKNNVNIQPQEWSGGRMVVECPACGKYEIAPGLYEELLPLPDTDWRIERLRSEISNIAEPRMIWKPSTNIAEVATIGADKPTKLEKRFLRAKAEGKTVTLGVVFHVDSVDDESAT